MVSPRVRAAIIVGILSVVVLGAVWAVVLQSLPTQHDIVEVRSGQPAPQPPAPPAPSAPLIPFQPLSPPSSPSPQTPLAPPEPPTPASPSSPSSPRLPSSPPGPHSSPQPALPPRPPAALRSQDIPSDMGMSPSCMAELEKLCPDAHTGAARRTCFQKNERRLSGPCRRQLDAMALRIKEDMQQFKTACEGDARRLCRGVEQGRGGILQCLEDKTKDLSDGCYQALRTRPFRK